MLRDQSDEEKPAKETEREEPVKWEGTREVSWKIKEGVMSNTMDRSNKD